MSRVFSIPHEPLARFRLLAIWFAASIAFLNVALFAFDAQLTANLRWEAAVSAALLGCWWIFGYRRGGFPVAGWIVDAVLTTIVAAWSPMPLRAIGVFYVGIQLRALYVPRREFMLLPLSYGIARLVSISIATGDQSITVLSAASLVQVIGLGVVAVTLHLFVDATSRQAIVEQALERSDERYRLVAGAMGEVVYDWNVVTGAIEWTASMQHVFGFAPETVGRTLTWWLSRVHPEDCAMLERLVHAVIGDPAVKMETARYRVRRADGSFAHVSWSMIVQRGRGGEAERVIGSIRDVTPEQQLEEQLRQSQKMEAVGQLAGGVAHDFNNLLTVIGGHVFMLEHALPRGATSERHLAGIMRASERAATLTKQLLAFSRKQILTPSVLNVNAVIDDVLQMMRPVIGEQVQIATRFDPLLSPAFADAGQLGQVLVNLALNARDAMPNGGLLAIETENVTHNPHGPDAGATPLPAGSYVRIVVRDTGTGMDAHTLARAFEPFFTTKPTGKGTGLGLATAYGIVKQSFGDIQASSIPGAGSSFSVLLPVATQPAPATVPSHAPAAVSPGGDGESRRVLLVEDDDGVRQFAEQVLLRAGYRVLSARNGTDALDRIPADELGVDLVVTDVVMPEMGGRMLVEHLRRRQPDLPVLYISGYTDDTRLTAELEASGARLLEKPFTAGALAAAVNEVSQSASRLLARPS
jgi:two-component system, cell cycle sensor histidine kinase and response regulator CckA